MKTSRLFLVLASAASSPRHRPCYRHFYPPAPSRRALKVSPKARKAKRTPPKILSPLSGRAYSFS